MTQRVLTELTWPDRLLRFNGRATLRAPAPLLRQLAGRALVNERGVRMDLHTQGLVRLNA